MSGPLLMPTWDSLATHAPQVADTMRRYLAQIECVLRPGSVRNTDQALRAFAAFLVQAYPQLQTIAAVERRHIEAFKPWLAARPGQSAVALSIRHRFRIP